MNNALIQFSAIGYVTLLITSPLFFVLDIVPQIHVHINFGSEITETLN